MGYTNLIVVNANHDKVLYYLDKMVSENDRYCRCVRCRQDALALALNTLPPHYFVETGVKDANELGSPWILIEVAAREALERVHLFPHHKPKDAETQDRQPGISPIAQDTGTEG